MVSMKPSLKTEDPTHSSQSTTYTDIAPNRLQISNAELQEVNTNLLGLTLGHSAMGDLPDNRFEEM